jgi:hypothetical protein
MNKTIEETIEIVDKMLAIPKAQMYWAAMRDKERQDELNKIEGFFDSKRYHACETTKIKDGMFIVELERKEPKETLFAVVVGGKDMHDMFFNFNDALLGAISYETTGRIEAGYWAAKLMRKEIPDAKEIRS